MKRHIHPDTERLNRAAHSDLHCHCITPAAKDSKLVQISYSVPTKTNRSPKPKSLSHDMQRRQSASTPVNTTNIALTAPSSFFTLEPIPCPGAANTPAVDRVAEPNPGHTSPGSMASRQSYDCFDTYDTGHFNSVDTLYDQGVWIGYLAEES